MRAVRRQRRIDEGDDAETRLGARFAVAFGSLFFSVPTCLLFALLGVPGGRLLGVGLGWQPLVWTVAAVAAFAFLFPRAVPDLLGKMMDFVFEAWRRW